MNELSPYLQLDDNIYRMLTVDEAVTLLGVSERKVRQMLADELLPSWKPSPGVVRIPYWMVIWRVSQDNGMGMAEMVGPVTKPVTTLLMD